MERLEKYLDWVCRRIGGPKEMRAHVRQELREHLLDAAAEHEAGGMGKEEAMKKALEDFGGPEEVREELESAHGARASAVVFEKAMQWKERTMKAKWLWMTWAHVALIKVIALGALFVAGMMIFVMPKVREITLMANADGRGMDGILPGSETFLGVLHILLQYWLVVALAAAGLWVWFEKRVKGENKSLMRLSALGTAAVVTILMAIAIGIIASIPLATAASMMTARLPENVVIAELTDLKRWGAEVEKSATAKDWATLDDAAHEGSGVAARLSLDGASAPGILVLDKQAKLQEIRLQLASVRSCLLEVRDAARKKDETRAMAAVRRFHDALAAVESDIPEK